MIQLGVNIDHVATLRQARGTNYPDPIEAAILAEQYGADLITLHLREDRRHIQDDDVRKMRRAITTRMNLESAITEEMVDIALSVKPDDVCLVPEKRMELTTEGGLDVIGGFDVVNRAVKKLTAGGIRVSLFIDPDLAQIDAAIQAGAPVIELHTGRYAEAVYERDQHPELERIKEAVAYGVKKGLRVNAGHGLHYQNVGHIAAISGITELNIGHAIVADAIFRGWQVAITDMKRLMLEAAAQAK